MKLVHLRRFLTATSCVALSCMCFIIYLNSLTITRDTNADTLQGSDEISAFISNRRDNTVSGVIRRKVHRDQSAVYEAVAEEEEASRPRDNQSRPPDARTRDPISRRDVGELPSTVPRRHLLPSVHLTKAPGPSDHSSPLSTANSPMYMHHARISSNESVPAAGAITLDIKQSAKSPLLSHSKERGQQSVWPSPGKPWDDRIVEQLRYLPHGTFQHDRLRTILVYSSLGTTPAGREKFLRDKCPVDECTLTTDVKWISQADAIVFPYDPGVEVLSWPRRPAHQIWILSLLESPLNLPSISGLSNQINWTATYRLDSSIVTPYEKFVPSGEPARPNRLPQSLTSRLRAKTKQVVWFVSNCISGNRRLEYARDLSNYIQVDIYGDCGKLKCSKQEPEQCQNKLRQEYKFYLAFENSNCQYYITEKFFNALRWVSNA